jgi:hypothetical protein
VRTCENIANDDKRAGVLTEQDRAVLYDSVPSILLEQIKEKNEKVVRRLNRTRMIDAIGLMILDKHKNIKPPRYSRKSELDLSQHKPASPKAEETAHKPKLEDEEGEKFDEDSEFDYGEDDKPTI